MDIVGVLSPPVSTAICSETSHLPDFSTGWAAALHATYAPELNIKGWAFGGTPANVSSTLVQVEGMSHYLPL